MTEQTIINHKSKEGEDTGIPLSSAPASPQPDRPALFVPTTAIHTAEIALVRAIAASMFPARYAVKVEAYWESTIKIENYWVCSNNKPSFDGTTWFFDGYGYVQQLAPADHLIPINCLVYLGDPCDE